MSRKSRDWGWSSVPEYLQAWQAEDPGLIFSTEKRKEDKKKKMTYIHGIG